MAQQRIFNLLKPIEPPPTLWDKVYDWLVNKVRVVILITELLIVIAFFGKVVEDTIAKGKDKTIQTLQKQLVFYNSKEGNYRQIQKKNDVYIQLWNNASGDTNILKEIYSYIPDTGSDITVKFEQGRISIFGYQDLQTLQQLELSLKNSKTFNSVYVETLTQEQKEIQNNKGQYVLIANINNNKRNPL